MANRRFIDFPIAASVGNDDIVLIWQDGLNKQTTKATLFAGSPNSLAGLTDVDISALANGQILQYNSTTSKWENVDRTDIDLDQLGDVTIVSPTNGQVLVYNSSTSKWENSSAGFVPYTGAVTTVNLGAQSILAGSFVKAGGTSAQFLKADGSVDSTAYGTGSVTSVALTMPSAFSVAGSPVTTTGTLAVTATGTTAQYIRGDGSLETFPSLTGFVPYTGATADVNLGTHDLTAERGTFQNNGSSDTLTVNHTSGSGYGIIVTKGGNGEALYVSKTTGSGNAMTVIGGRTSLVDLALSSVTNTAGDFLTLSGGVVHKRTAAEVRTDIGAGTVTSVAALTLGTSGTDLSSTVANGTTTPVITLNVPTASATNRGALSSADWSTFNSKQNALTLTTTGTSGAATLVGATLNIPQYQAAGTYVTSVTASSPLASSGGTTPNITIQQSNGSQNGFLSSTDWTTFNNKANANGSNASGTWGINITGNSTSVINTVTGTNSAELVRGNMADNDHFRILVGGTASNAGFAEIATADDGTEPIHVRQYTGVFSTLIRTATLLDASGNTNFPGSVGIGTNDPKRGLHVSGTGANAEFTLTETAMAVGSKNFNFVGNASNGTWSIRTLTDNSLAQSVNFVSFLASNGAPTFTNLAGSGTRMVVADANGLLSTQAIGSGAITGSGASGQIAYFNGTTSITSESNLFWDATNNRLGINNATPSKALDIISNVAQDGIKISGSSNPRLTIIDTTNNVQFDVLTTDTEAVLRTDTNHPLHFTTNGALKMALFTDGNVSISNSPSNAGFKLQVDGEGRFYQPATTSTAYLRVQNNRSRNAALRLTTTVGDYYLGVGIGADVNQFQIFDGNAGETRLTIASTGAATFRASFALPHTTKSANYTLDATDYTVGFDCASNRTANLPDATTCAGRIYVVYQYNTGGGARSVTLDGNGSQTINGMTTYSLSPFCDLTSVMIQSNGSNWIIIASNFTVDCM
jgi:hypothetical protein